MQLGHVVPPSYKRGKAAPVVLVFHGGGGNAADMRWRTGMNVVSDREGFIAVYAAGSSSKQSDRMLYWNSGPKAKDPAQHAIDDVRYVQSLLDDLARYFTVDPKRVFATGFSNGAQMCFMLECKLPGRIAAIAPVAGQRSLGEFCTAPRGPVNIICFHGKLDPYAPYGGGKISGSVFKPHATPPVPGAIRKWAAHNGCPDEPRGERWVGKAHRVAYGPGRQGSEVILWTLENAGHTWPGDKVPTLEATGKLGELNVARPVGPVNTDIKASELIWSFFEAHPRK